MINCNPYWHANYCSKVWKTILFVLFHQIVGLEMWYEAYLVVITVWHVCVMIPLFFKGQWIWIQQFCPWSNWKTQLRYTFQSVENHTINCYSTCTTHTRKWSQFLSIYQYISKLSVAKCFWSSIWYLQAIQFHWPA